MTGMTFLLMIGVKVLSIRKNIFHKINMAVINLEGKEYVSKGREENVFSPG